MYIEDAGEDVWGCYNCFTFMGDYDSNDEGLHECGECSEPTILHFSSALKLIAQLKEDEILYPSESSDELEDYYDE